jgi:cell division protein FtsI/penicillin-binding protein 2
VAIRPSTGAILAIGDSPATEGVDIALTGQYPPGSVFKVATALAGLRAGMDPDSTLQCPASLTVDGRQFTNYDGYPSSRLGAVTLREAFAYSCNTAFIGTAQTISSEALAAAASDLGVGVGLPLGVDAFTGSVEPEATGTEHAAEMIGQGQVLVTPAVMAVVAASVAAGARVTPRLVLAPEIAASDYQSAPSGLTSAEAEALASMMRSAVESGTADALGDLGGEVGAKTGTAEYGTESPPRTHAWMIAIDAEMDLAVAVLVEDGGSGGATAGPLMASFLEQVRQNATPPPEGA